ncbi:hypothetical protein BGW41_001061 [Actinomortierella wolfii]|nr:hypothetical protein BGW41_001061 [Actinomortierella wolfii]
MEKIESPFDDWSQHIHAVITILKPYFGDWRSYASLVSTLLGIGILVMENQVLLRMRMGRWEILGYIIWCISIAKANHLCFFSYSYTTQWHLCLLYIPVNYLLFELCDVHRENAKILIPLEILVDVCLYNGPFLTVLLRLLYLAWKVAYDEAVLTGAIFEDEEAGAESPIPGLFRGGRSTRVSSGPSTRGSRGGSTRNGGNYVGLAMVDLDEADHPVGSAGSKSEQSSASAHKGKGSNSSGGSDDDTTNSTTIYVLDDEDDHDEDTANPSEHDRKMSKNHSQSPKSTTSSPTSPSTSSRKSRSTTRGGSPQRIGSPPANLAVSTSPSTLTPRSTSPSGYRSPKSTSPSPSSYTTRGSPLRNVAYSSTFDDPSSTEDDDDDGQGDDRARRAFFSS